MTEKKFRTLFQKYPTLIFLPRGDSRTDKKQGFLLGFEEEALCEFKCVWSNKLGAATSGKPYQEAFENQR